MGLFRKAKPGTLYDGYATYCQDYELVPRPGYYALDAAGKQLRRPLLRLVCVDDAPGDADDGACHYEVAGKKDPPQKAGTLVSIEAHADGDAKVAS